MRVADIVSLTEGVARLVHDGDTVALEGFTHLIPVAAGNEIIRQGRRALGWNLRVVDDPARSQPPTADELRVLRDLHARTSAA